MMADSVIYEYLQNDSRNLRQKIKILKHSQYRDKHSTYMYIHDSILRLGSAYTKLIQQRVESIMVNSSWLK